jgi:hypothetical protein
VQVLAEQAEHAALAGQHGQAVVAEVAPAGAVADLAQLGVQRGVAGEVELGGVVHQQHRAGLVQQQPGGVLGVRPEDTGVGDGGGVHEVVTAPQRVGVTELHRQRALRVPVQAVGQAARPAHVAELGLAEMLLPEGGGRRSVNNRQRKPRVGQRGSGE